MRLSCLLHGLKDARLINDCQVNGIAYDSRDAKENHLFVAIKGFELDGHAFIADAFLNKASGVVSQKHVSVPIDKGLAIVKNSRFALSHLACNFYRDPSSDLLTVGVTGTKGKTTVCHMIKQILDASGHKTGLLGTVHNILGNTIVPGERTTPESSDLFKLQRQMVDTNCTAVTMEVSSHALALSRVSHVKFDIGVFTNIGTDHLDFHKTFENYIALKANLFQMLNRFPKPQNESYPTFAVLNKDDPHYDYFRSFTKTKLITYGFSADANVRACDIITHPDQSTFMLCFNGKKQKVRINLPGTFNIENALAASAVGFGLGMTMDSIVQVIANLKGVRGRAELVHGPQDFTVWIDYAHTPESLKDILKTAKMVSNNRVIGVFGCGGDRDKHKRPIMGQIAGSIADIVIITNDNPRTENPNHILDQIEQGISKTQSQNLGLTVLRIPDRRSAINKAIFLAKKGDVVVIAGKGHETEQVFAKETKHFDDAEEARKAIALKYR